MDILIQNQNIIISVTVLLGIIIVGLFFIPYLKKLGLIKQNDIKNTEKIIEITNALINVVEFNHKDQIKSIFAIVENVFEYISNSMSDNVDKQKLTYDATIKILNEMNIEVTKEIQELIKIAISNVNFK